MHSIETASFLKLFLEKLHNLVSLDSVALGDDFQGPFSFRVDFLGHLSSNAVVRPDVSGHLDHEDDRLV